MGALSVTVIVSVYNVERYLGKCVNSILEQSSPAFEVLLTDDESTDGSGALCERLAADDARVRAVHKESAGLGLRATSGWQPSPRDDARPVRGLGRLAGARHGTSISTGGTAMSCIRVASGKPLYLGKGACIMLGEGVTLSAGFGVYLSPGCVVQVGDGANLELRAACT